MRSKMLAQDSLAVIDRRFVAANDRYSYGDAGKTAPSRSNLPRKTNAPKRVLIVEDNLDSVHSLALLVADMGHTVDYAINGYVALEVARRFRPDFVLLDLALPGMDGFEVSTRITQIPELAHTRLIALTAFGQDEYRVRSKIGRASC